MATVRDNYAKVTPFDEVALPLTLHGLWLSWQVREVDELEEVR